MQLVNKVAKYYRDYWVELDKGIKGAVIGALIAIIGIYIQDSQQRQRDMDQQAATELKKLRYLNFLWEDVYYVIKQYDENAKMLDETYKVNPFIIRSYGSYSYKSLDIIVNQLNHEDYYMAILNQLQDDSLGETFFLSNAMLQQLTNTQEHYYAERPKMIDFKVNYSKATVDLQSAIGNYVQMSLNNQLPVQPPTVVNALRQILVDRNAAYSSISPDEDKWLMFQDSLLVKPVISVLKNNANNSTLKALAKQADDVYEKSRLCLFHKMNVINAVITTQPLIDDEYRRMKELITPLKNRLESLPGTGTPGYLH